MNFFTNLMSDTNFLPLIFDMKSPNKSYLTRVTSPANRSIQIAMTDFNTKIYNKKHNKVKENRLKTNRKLDWLNIENISVQFNSQNLSPENSKEKKKFKDLEIMTIKTNNINEVDKSVTVELTSPNYKEPDLISPNKISLLKNPKMNDSENHVVLKTEINNEAKTRKNSNKPKISIKKRSNNLSFHKDEALYSLFYRALQKNMYGNKNEKAKKINNSHLKENSFFNSVSNSKRGRDSNNLPIVHPSMFIRDNTYKSLSQKRRYDSICHQLNSLRYIILKGSEETDYDLIRDFLKFNKINDSKFFSLDSIFKISNFVKSGINAYPNETLADLLSRVISKENNENPTQKVECHSISKENKPSHNKKKQNALRKMTDKTFNLKHDLNFNDKFVIKRETDIDLIKRLENDLAESKNKAIMKKIDRVKSKTIRKEISRDEVDSDFEKDDLEKIKKNNKLLELIVVMKLLK